MNRILRRTHGLFTSVVHRPNNGILTAACTDVPHRRHKCSLNNNIVPGNSGTGGLDLTFLGTSSQGGARRYPSCLALRLRGHYASQVWLFDAGEGATAQLQRSNMKIGLVRNIFITHMHGDHLYGLPGLVMCILGRRDEASSDHSLHIYGPQGIRNFLRTALGVSCFRVPKPTDGNGTDPADGYLHIHELVWPYGCGPVSQRNRHRKAKSYWNKVIRPLLFEGHGRNIEPERDSNGNWTYRLIDKQLPIPQNHQSLIIPVNNSKTPTSSSSASSSSSSSTLSLRAQQQQQEASQNSIPASVLAAPVLHTIPTFAYSIEENVLSKRFNKDKLTELGIPKDGRDEVRKLFTSWLNEESGVWKGRKIDIKQVIENGRKPRSICITGDTYDASPAAHIAQGVDVLIHEATNMANQTELAKKRGHSSTLGATSFAKKVGAKRLILNHTSVAYSERKINALENEARAMFGSNKVFVARDLSVFSVPTEEEDSDHFVFRRFHGFANSYEYKELYSSSQAPVKAKQADKDVRLFRGTDFAVEDEHEHVDGDGEGDEDDKHDGDMTEIEELHAEDDDDEDDDMVEHDDEADSEGEGRKEGVVGPAARGRARARGG